MERKVARVRLDERKDKVKKSNLTPKGPKRGANQAG
jgi:hypothetical protein